jgi:cytochrome b561
MSVPRLRYSLPAIFLHWGIAILIVVNVWLGFRYQSLNGFAQFQVLQWHKSVGVTILVLAVLRVSWRMLNPPPAALPSVLPWQRKAARYAHGMLYILMVLLPLTGWIIVSASPTNIRTLLYGAIPWPHLGFVHSLVLAQRKSVEAVSTGIHHLLLYILCGLVLLHVSAALKHQFYDQDDLLARMLPRPFRLKTPVPGALDVQHAQR